MNFKGINLLLLPLETSENLTFSDIFSGIEATDRLNSLELYVKYGDDILYL